MRLKIKDLNENNDTIVSGAQVCEYLKIHSSTSTVIIINKEHWKTYWKKVQRIPPTSRWNMKYFMDSSAQEIDRVEFSEKK